MAVSPKVTSLFLWKFSLGIYFFFLHFSNISKYSVWVTLLSLYMESHLVGAWQKRADVVENDWIWGQWFPSGRSDRVLKCLYLCAQCTVVIEFQPSQPFMEVPELSSLTLIPKGFWCARFNSFKLAWQKEISCLLCGPRDNENNVMLSSFQGVLKLLPLIAPLFFDTKLWRRAGSGWSTHSTEGCQLVCQQRCPNSVGGSGLWGVTFENIYRRESLLWCSLVSFLIFIHVTDWSRVYCSLWLWFLVSPLEMRN